MLASHIPLSIFLKECNLANFQILTLQFFKHNFTTISTELSKLNSKKNSNFAKTKISSCTHTHMYI